MNKVLLGVAVVALCLPIAAFANGDDESAELRVPRGGYYVAENAQFAGDEEGILVSGVIEDSPAERAGIMRGDIVLAIDGTEVNTISELQSLFADYEAGQTVEALVSRGGEEVTIEVELETRLYRPVFGITAAGGGFGFGMPYGRDVPNGRGMPFGGRMPHDQYRGPAPFSNDDFPFRFHMDPDGDWGPGLQMFGDVVRSVVDGGPADEAGIVAGDIIVRIDDSELVDTTIGEAVSGFSPGDTVEIELERHTAAGEFETVVVNVTLGSNDDGGAYLGIGYSPMRFQMMGEFMDRFGDVDDETYPRGFRGLRGYPRADEDALPQDMSM